MNVSIATRILPLMVSPRLTLSYSMMIPVAGSRPPEGPDALGAHQRLTLHDATDGPEGYQGHHHPLHRRPSSHLPTTAAST